MKNSLLLFSLILIFLPVFAQNQSISLSESSIGFTIKNAGISVDGLFATFSGAVNFDENKLATSTIAASIVVESIETGIDMRNEHLLQEEYFNVAKYKNISFSSTKITKTSNGYLAQGNLKIKDVSKLIDLPFSISKNGSKRIFTSNLTLNRRDYNVGGNSWILADDVSISIKIVTQ